MRFHWSGDVERDLQDDFQVVVQARKHADALIEIASAFEPGVSPTPRCSHCGYLMTWNCRSDCPNLLARRALGVA